MLSINRALNQITRIWDGLRENFAQIITGFIMVVSMGTFALLIIWAFVGQDGETIYPRVAEADALGVLKWLVALAVSGVVSLKSCSYLKRLRS